MKKVEIKVLQNGVMTEIEGELTTTPIDDCDFDVTEKYAENECEADCDAIYGGSATLETTITCWECEKPEHQVKIGFCSLYCAYDYFGSNKNELFDCDECENKLEIAGEEGKRYIKHWCEAEDEDEDEIPHEEDNPNCDCDDCADFDENDGQYGSGMGND
ncbi:hypothetical protein ELUMI_v1c05350 [Williamsoniiplasma luminosum]|uniref:Uncharacterized protein n=1 Tax=Williamsoniiplasma luminosum TaxID=214888 RepID=A0A2K8NTY9_9MOLU|nr:hypothetical protein [Williamsoniiplasma luminosum]ATZ17259.1 hypothetical protein ELUMI_v1c05350 [Williamsoniiplasma luminosum]